MSFEENLTSKTNNAENEINNTDSNYKNVDCEANEKADVYSEQEKNSNFENISCANSELSEEFEQLEQPKKKFILQGTVITACCIFLTAVLAFICYNAFFALKLTNNVWKYEVENGVTLYFSFDKDNNIAMSYGSSTYYGDYQVAKVSNEESNEKKQAIAIAQNEIYFAQFSPVSGAYYYEITGNKFFGDIKLLLTSPSGEVTTLTCTKPPKFDYNTKNNVLDKSLNGKWEYTDSSTGQSISFTFTDKGMVTQSVNYYYNGKFLGRAGLECSYSISQKPNGATNDEVSTVDETSTSKGDKTYLALTYYNGAEKTTEQIPYTLNGDTLTLGEIKLTKVKN